MSKHGQAIGSVGWQAPVHSEWTTAERATIRELYRAGKLSLSAVVLASVRMSDHGHAVASGKVAIGDLLSHGVSVAKANAAYQRETSGTPAKRAEYQRTYQRVYRAEKALEAPAIEAALIERETDATQRAVLAKLARVNAAKRDASKAAETGRVLSGAELAAIAAQYGARVAR